MAKGTYGFRTMQHTSIPIPLEELNTQVLHQEKYNSFELPLQDLDLRIAIKFWILKARKEFSLSDERLPLPILSYKLRGNILGQACYSKHSISLNPLYIEYHAYEVINDTIPHEVCHLVTAIIYGRHIYPHGKEWQNVCLKLGHYPSRCNSKVASYKVLKQQTEQAINKMSVKDF